VRSIYFWIIVLLATGVLGLEDIAKFVGMEEQAKPAITWINEHIHISEWIKRAKETVRDLALPEGLPDGLVDKVKKD